MLGQDVTMIPGRDTDGIRCFLSAWKALMNKRIEFKVPWEYFQTRLRISEVKTFRILSLIQTLRVQH